MNGERSALKRQLARLRWSEKSQSKSAENTAEAAEGLVAPLRECVCPRCAEPVEHTLQTFDA